MRLARCRRVHGAAGPPRPRKNGRRPAGAATGGAGTPRKRSKGGAEGEV